MSSVRAFINRDSHFEEVVFSIGMKLITTHTKLAYVTYIPSSVQEIGDINAS